MKYIFLMVLLAFTGGICNAQDLIVTDEGDSINCRITKKRSENIYFTFRHNSEIRNTLLPVSRVKSHAFNFFPDTEVPLEKVIATKDYRRFRFDINSGYSYQPVRLSKSIPDDFRNYYNQLKSGHHIDGGMIFYFNEIYGIGAKYYLYKSSNSLENIYIEDIEGTRTYGRMSDDMVVTFIGPSFSTRFMSRNKKNAFITNFSIGYMDYTNDKVIIRKYRMTGNTLGLAMDTGYDIGISKNLALGLKVSLTSGTLFKYDWQDGNTTRTIELEPGAYESLYRADFSAGLRFSR